MGNSARRPGDRSATDAVDAALVVRAGGATRPADSTGATRGRHAHAAHTAALRAGLGIADGGRTRLPGAALSGCAGLTQHAPDSAVQAVCAHLAGAHGVDAARTGRLDAATAFTPGSRRARQARTSVSPAGLREISGLTAQVRATPARTHAPAPGVWASGVDHLDTRARDAPSRVSAGLTDDAAPAAIGATGARETLPRAVTAPRAG
jgi:hypothetical protein